jgi:hypothetical protein
MFIITVITVLCETYRGPTAREIYAMQKILFGADYLTHAWNFQRTLNKCETKELRGS